MFETPYAHGIIRKIVVGFGTLFSNIQIPRKDSNGVIQQVVRVPLAYAPKEKWHVRVDQDPDQANHIYTTLPRMSFEVTGYSYDTTRMVNRNNTIKCYSNGTVSAMYSPVPYNVDFSLYVLTKGTEDGLAILEQILPLFAPEYSLNLNAIPEMNITQDVPIILNNVSLSDDYEGDFQTRRLVTHTFTFTAKANLYGPVKTSKLITKTNIDVDTNLINTGERAYEAQGVPETGIINIDRWYSRLDSSNRNVTLTNNLISSAVGFVTPPITSVTKDLIGSSLTASLSALTMNRGFQSAVSGNFASVVPGSFATPLDVKALTGSSLTASLSNLTPTRSFESALSGNFASVVTGAFTVPVDLPVSGVQSTLLNDSTIGYGTGNLISGIQSIMPTGNIFAFNPSLFINISGVNTLVTNNTVTPPVNVPITGAVSTFSDTAIITPSTSFGDPYFANVSSLLHFDGVNGSTTFTDQIPHSFSVATGTSSISTAQSKFGGASLLHNDGSSLISSAADIAWDITGNDFTVETWLRLTSYSTAQGIVIATNATTNGWVFVLKGVGDVSTISFQTINAGAFRDDVNSSDVLSQITLNTWHHIAVTYSLGTNTYKFFLNGVQKGTATSNGAVGAGSTLSIGRYIQNPSYPNYYWSGYLDDLRITKGVARYTGNFSVPTAAFPNS